MSQIKGAPTPADDDDRIATWKIWCEHVEEADAALFDTDTPIGVVLLYLDTMIAPADGKAFAEDYLVRTNISGSKIHRFRVELAAGAAGIIIEALRACRKCGCTDDRACEHGCSWVGPDKCSECFPT